MSTEQETTSVRVEFSSHFRGVLKWVLSGDDLPATLWCLFPLLLLGFLLSLSYSFTALPLMMGASALLAGAAIGFLFGVPRTVQSEEAGAPNATEPPQQLVNTSLQQISDWLVKIIVGVSLVELRKIQKYLQSVASTFAGEMPPGHQSQAFAGAILTYFGVLGFLSGYLLTRLFLSGAFFRALSTLTRQEVKTIATSAVEQSVRRTVGLTAAVFDAVQNPGTMTLPPEIASDDGQGKTAVALARTDPNKGQFGGKPSRNGRILTAKVDIIPGNKDFCHVHLETTSTDPDRRLLSPVTYSLHPTFPKDPVVVLPINGVASLDRLSWGAFTVGVETDEGRTRLELDLAEVEDAPVWFRDR